MALSANITSIEDFLENFNQKRIIVGGLRRCLSLLYSKSTPETLYFIKIKKYLIIKIIK